jgi:hypothetical protein
MDRRPGSRKTAPRKPPAAEPPPSSQPSGSRCAEVVLDVEVERDRVHLILANCGDAVATEIRVEFSRDLLGIGGSLGVSGLPIFKRLGVLRPGRVLRIFWDAAPTLLAHRGQTAPFVATVSWNERSRPRQHAEYHHDLSIYEQWPECLESSSEERERRHFQPAKTCVDR